VTAFSQLVQPSTLSPSAEEPPCALIVDTRSERADRIAVALAEEGLTVAIISEPDDLLQAAMALRPDIILCALEPLRFSAIELCDEVKSRQIGIRSCFVVTVDDDLDEEAAAAILFAGADDLITRADSRPSELRARVRGQLRHKRALDSLRRVRIERDALRQRASTDPLTGLWNRRGLDTVLAGHLHALQPFVVAFVDIDHFKLINDRYGHGMGDAVLVRLAEDLNANVRPEDAVARLGGEEFVIVLFGLGLDNGLLAAERLRRAVSCTPMEGGPAEVTVSIGIAGFDPSAPVDSDELLRRADLALYAAKRGGRDRTIVWPLPEGSMNSKEESVSHGA